MISRRNIRVKVMQAIYALDAYSLTPSEAKSGTPATPEENEKTGIKVLVEKIQRSSDLFALMLLYVSKVAQFSETSARQRASKYLPTQEDLEVKYQNRRQYLSVGAAGQYHFPGKSKGRQAGAPDRR
jgi:transcription antitermination protein NusB